MPMTLPVYFRAAWTAMGLVWALAAVSAKRTVRAEPAGSRTGHILVLAIAFALLFSPGLRIGPLAWRLVPSSAAAAVLGLGLTIGGIVVAIWARVYLGGNWSAIVAIKQGHTLIRTGPYAVVRHPIYAGLLLAMLGTAIGEGEIGCFYAAILALAAWLAKARREDSFLLQQFGAAYLTYQSQVKALIPFVL